MTPHLADTPVLETGRLILRAPRAQDWEQWRAFFLSDRAEFIRPGDATEGLAWRAFGHVIGHWVMRQFGLFVFTAKDNDAPLGLTGPWFPAGWPEREIGWSVWSPAAEGKGFAFEAAAAARDFAYRTLGWPVAVSYINPENARSIALAERLGAVLDRDAAAPSDSDLVYRHPAPETLR